jgi:hypothetical protein
MKLKEEIKAVLGGAANQVEFSLSMLEESTLTQNQRFHLRQIAAVLVVDAPQEEEP